LTKREIEATNQEVKREVTKLLLDAGLRLRQEGPTFGKGEAERQPVQRRKRRRYKVLDPLPTLPYPQVTRFEIVAPKPLLECRLNETEILLVETDADSEFDRRGAVALRSEPLLLEPAAKAPLKGGRVRWRVRAKQGAPPGSTGVLIATITKPDGTQIADQIPFTVLEAVEEKSRKDRGFVPPFEIIAINPYDDTETWNIVWPNLPDDSQPGALEAVAYKPVPAGGAINVYYSTIFSPFKAQIDKLKNDNTTLSDLFRTNYEVWIGYHAILQENEKDERDEVDQETLEDFREAERVRVSQMEVRQSMRTADLIHQGMKNRAASEEDE
jgi:hypothetical protein